jgi:hypothetical protein
MVAGSVLRRRTGGTPSGGAGLGRPVCAFPFGSGRGRLPGYVLSARTLGCPCPCRGPVLVASGRIPPPSPPARSRPTAGGGTGPQAGRADTVSGREGTRRGSPAGDERGSRVRHEGARVASAEERGPGGGTDPQANPAPPEGVPPSPALEDGTLGHGRRHGDDTGAGGTVRAARPAFEDGTLGHGRRHGNDIGAGGTVRAARPALEDGTLGHGRRHR